MIDKKTKRKRGGFPSHAASNETKDTYEYGLDVGDAIEGQWFSEESAVFDFYQNRRNFHNLRLYSKGDQNVSRYKDEFSINGDLSYLNLDWKPVPIVPKFVDIVVNGMQDRDFDVVAQAVDPVASADRLNYLESMRAEMEVKDELQALQDATGVEVFEHDPESLPGSEEELEVHMQLDYKQGVEMAMESAINYELKINEYDNIKYRVDYDLATIGIGAIRHEFVRGEGIKVQYVDPANLVYSNSESRFYDDCFYFGEVKRIHITDLQVQFPHMTPDEIETIQNAGVANNSFGTITSYAREENSDYEQGFVDVLFFCYKTVHNEIYKYKESTMGTPKVIAKDITFNPPKDKSGGHERLARSNEVIYEGVKVIGHDILLKWELQKNMIKPTLQSPKVIMPYIVASPKQYHGKVYSLVQRMEKYADAIQLINLKIQQVIQRMTPSGIFLDADGLAEIDLGNGTQYNPQTALDMYFQTGTIIGRSMTNEGEFNHGKIPIQELPGGQGQQIQTLLGAYEYNLQQIRNVTGLNEARDGSTPDPKALVGVQKLAALNSNTATRHILESSEYLKRRLSEGLCLRISDVLDYSPTKDDYLNAIGKYNVEILEDLGDMSAHEFGIFIELGPDEEEKAKLDGHINASISRGELKIEDAVDIMAINSIKIANQVLKLKRRQRVEQEQAFQQQNIKQQNDGLAQVAQAKAKAEAEAAQIKAQSEIQVEQAKSQFAMQKLEMETQLEIQIIDHKAQVEAEMQGRQMSFDNMQNDKKHRADQSKEAAKAKGSGLEATNVSVGSKANTVDGKTRSGGLL